MIVHEPPFSSFASRRGLVVVIRVVQGLLLLETSVQIVGVIAHCLVDLISVLVSLDTTIVGGGRWRETMTFQITKLWYV